MLQGSVLAITVEKGRQRERKRDAELVQLIVYRWSAVGRNIVTSNVNDLVWQYSFIILHGIHLHIGSILPK
jgi:hypothetical protein